MILESKITVNKSWGIITYQRILQYPVNISMRLRGNVVLSGGEMKEKNLDALRANMYILNTGLDTYLCFEIKRQFH